MERRALPRPLKLAAMLMLCTAVAVPCSWDTTPVLYFENRPDWPIARYVDGQLGIVQPTYARSHLVVAFRYLSGKPPSAAERDGFRALLEHRLKEGTPRVDPAEQWERLRTTVRGEQYKWPPDQTRAGADGYEFYTNCTDDAFATASATLASRMKTFGAAHPAVLRWLDAQEMVFANCSEGEVKIPADDPSLPPLLRADRRYQIAAANFYALRYDDARAQFLAIARDAQSPWQKTARLVAARALIRAENLGVTVKEADPLTVANNELVDILDDPAMQPLHEAAWDLLALTTFRLAPQERLTDAVQGLLGGEASARRVRAHLADYTILLDKDVAGDDELTDWIRTFQAGNFAHALARWQATKKTHWLVAALAHVKPEDASVRPLLEASASIAADSPAATTIAHHRARLLSAIDRDDDARAALDRALARDVPASARNHLLRQRRGLARNLAEFLRDLPAKPVGSGSDTVNAEESESQLPPDAAVVLNYWTPLATLQLAAQDETLPENIRSEIRRAVSVRAALLRKPSFDTALELARDPSGQPYVEPLDGNDEHWWCAGGSRYDGDLARETPLPLFLDDTTDVADTEAEKLTKLGSGASWILRTAIARAKSHPKDERVPEALSLAIHATRRTCGDEETERLAKRAFQVLHRQYGKTKWAEETPYWYKPYG